LNPFTIKPTAGTISWTPNGRFSTASTVDI
jgi:hypothetical protein